MAATNNTGYMRVSEAMRRTGRAARATGSAVRSSAHAGATAGRRTGGFVHRITGASGAGRTGLSTLIELTAAGGAGDAFVAVSLAGAPMIVDTYCPYRLIEQVLHGGGLTRA